MIRRRTALLAYLSLQGLACEGSGAPPATSAVRDSAGVEIVESFAPAWAEGEAWRVDAAPVFDLSGQVDEELFRLSRPRRLRDGRLVVYNGGTCQIRFYDQSGSLLTAWGRCGEGPGEFEEFGGLWPWRGDSLLVVDQLPRRASIFDGDGALGRTALVPTSGDLPLPFVNGVLSDGSFVLSGMRDPVGRNSPGMETSQASLGLARTLDDPLRLLGIYPGSIWEYTEFAGRLTRTRLAFGSSTEFASGRERFFVGLPDRFEIQVYASDGTLLRIMRRAFEPIEVTQDDINWLMERRLGQVDDAEAQRAVRGAFRDLRHADVMPAFGPPIWPGGAEGGPSMMPDDVGNLWVFSHYRPGEYQNHWTVFSPDGVWGGTVTLPDGFRPSQIGNDFVIGRWTDDTGFVHVRQYGLIKP